MSEYLFYTIFPVYLVSFLLVKTNFLSYLIRVSFSMNLIQNFLLTRKQSTNLVSSRTVSFFLICFSVLCQSV